MKKFTILVFTLTLTSLLIHFLPQAGLAQACNNVTTFAGTSAGTADGTLATAQFDNPRDIAIDRDGNIFVADGDNHTIRKITPAGIVSTFAGFASNLGGDADGLGTAARFDTPVGLVFDQSGNLFVADAGNRLIRRITPDGMVSTFVGNGSGTSTFTAGTGTSIPIATPRFIRIDSQDNLYVTNNDDYIIKITPGAVVSLFAGSDIDDGTADGTGTAARFDNPSGMTFDNQGNLFVADLDNHTIRRITPAGVVTTFAGTAGSDDTIDGDAATARFDNPRGLVFDAEGNLLVGQGTNHNGGERTLRKIAPSGIVSTIAGSGDSDDDVDGIGTAARFNDLRNLVFDASGTNLYVVDVSNDKIRLINNCVPFLLTAAPIPTMNQWGLLIFGLLILNLGVFIIGRMKLA